MKKRLCTRTLGLALTAAALLACSDGTENTMPVPPASPFRDSLPPSVRDSDKLALTDRRIDYSLALRSAAIRLVGDYPSLVEIEQVQNATDQKAAYELVIDQYLQDARFTTQMIAFWQNTFKMGGTVTFVDPDDVGISAMVNLDIAPLFATKLVVTGADFRQLVTASSGTCNTFTAPNTFTPVACTNTTEVGVLTNAGVQAQFFATLAFRRLRWVQETLTCAKFPAETGGTKIQFQGGVYSSPWSLDSISGLQSVPTASVDFQSTSSVICATCHGTMNHQAPLFGVFDFAGVFQPGASFFVPSPIPGQKAKRTDWLPRDTEVPAWRFGQPTPDMRAFGAAIAADPQFPQCVANRIWNWAFSRGNVVTDQATLTPELASQLVGTLTSNNWSVKKLIRETFVSPIFVRY